jgi:hypothetical protein
MSLTPDTGNLHVRSLVQTSNINVGQTLTAAILKGSLDYNYLSNVSSLGTLAQSMFASNAGAFGSNNGAFGSNSAVWSSNNCVKGSSLSNASYPIMITSTTPRLELLWNGGTSGSLDSGFSTLAFQGSNGAFARIRANDNNYSASLSFQTRTSGSDNSNMLTRMVIQSTGYVGIINTSPGSLLDVSGNVNCTSFTTNGTLTACNSTLSNLTVNRLVQSTLNFSATNPDFFCKVCTVLLLMCTALLRQVVVRYVQSSVVHTVQAVIGYQSHSILPTLVGQAC